MRIGVAGLGRIGVMHARNLAATAGVDEVVLIGRSRERAEEFRQRVDLAGLGAGAAPLVAGDGWDAELDRLDGVVVATTTSTHPDFARRAARAGVPALVEKPLALDVASLERLADEIEATGSEVMVAFHRRYDPAHQELRRRVGSGELGVVRAVRATGHDHHALPVDYVPVSGGIWHDMLVHDFDSIPWVTGQRVVSVWAAGSVLDAPVHAEHDDVDTALAVLVLESGATATVSGVRRNGAGQDVRLEVFGTRDTAAVGLDARTPVTSAEPGVPAPARGYEDFAERFAPAFRAEMRAFVDLVAGVGANLTPPREGVVALRIADAAARSLRTGETVSLL